MVSALLNVRPLLSPKSYYYIGLNLFHLPCFEFDLYFVHIFKCCCTLRVILARGKRSDYSNQCNRQSFEGYRIVFSGMESCRVYLLIDIVRYYITI